MKFLAPSKDFTPSPEAAASAVGGGAPAGASARAATVATAAGTAAGDWPAILVGGGARRVVDRRDGAARRRATLLRWDRPTSRANVAGARTTASSAARRGEGRPPAARDDESGMPTKNPRGWRADDRAAPTVTDDGRREHAREAEARGALRNVSTRSADGGRAQRRSAAPKARRKRDPGAPSRPRARVKTIQNHAPRSECASRGEPQFRVTIRVDRRCTEKREPIGEIQGTRDHRRTAVSFGAATRGSRTLRPRARDLVRSAAGTSYYVGSIAAARIPSAAPAPPRLPRGLSPASHARAFPRAMSALALDVAAAQRNLLPSFAHAGAVRRCSLAQVGFHRHHARAPVHIDDVEHQHDPRTRRAVRHRTCFGAGAMARAKPSEEARPVERGALDEAPRPRRALLPAADPRASASDPPCVPSRRRDAPGTASQRMVLARQTATTIRERRWAT